MQLVEKLSLVAGRFGERVVRDLFLVVLNKSVVGQNRFRPDPAHVVSATGQQRVGHHSSILKKLWLKQPAVPRGCCLSKSPRHELADTAPLHSGDSSWMCQVDVVVFDTTLTADGRLLAKLDELVD